MTHHDAPSDSRPVRAPHRLPAQWLTCIALLSLALPALAAPHAAYVPHRLDGTPTFKARHQVGQMVFAMTFPEARLQTVQQAMTTLRFSEGMPPAAWWGRSYFPCTLREGIAALPSTVRQFRLATFCELDRERLEATAFDIDDAHLGPTWNTASFDGSSLNRELVRLPSGNHTLTVARHLNYRIPTPDKRTGEISWEPASIVLAKGTLAIVVTP
ncbi:MAG: hypothetical protein H7338_18760 [Candidatus Sericytochromatia bacterium]|nr:hypothetical protein [Candidatus Sericytochromatia bacterium]